MEKAILTVEEFANMEFPKPEFKYWSYDNEYISCHYEKCHTYDIPISELRSAAGACMWLGILSITIMLISVYSKRKSLDIFMN